MKAATALTYRQYPTGWGLASAERKNYLPGAAKDIGSDRWSTMTTLTVMKVAPEGIDQAEESFSIAVPTGTRVWSEWHGANFKLSQDRSPGELISLLRESVQPPDRFGRSGWLMVGLIDLLFATACVVFRKWFRF